jgi:Aldehyde:ferredoxin oxidoreductase
MNLSKYSIRGTIMRDGMTLVVDLRSGSIHTKKDEGEREYIGGGLGAYMLNKRIKGDVDAMGPENVLVITSGPFAGMLIPAASGIGIFSKSPLTGYFGEDYLFGAFGNQMSRAGYASIIIRGVSERPVYLYIDDGVCTIKKSR